MKYLSMLFGLMVFSLPAISGSLPLLTQTDKGLLDEAGNKYELVGVYLYPDDTTGELVSKECKDSVWLSDPKADPTELTTGELPGAGCYVKAVDTGEMTPLVPMVDILDSLRAAVKFEATPNNQAQSCQYFNVYATPGNYHPWDAIARHTANERYRMDLFWSLTDATSSQIRYWSILFCID